MIPKKGFLLQMQVVCDHQMKIIDLFVGFPGSVHDSRVFRNSPLHNNLANKCGRYFLLADSGYPLKTNVLTPFKDRGNLTRREQNYNLKLARNRYVVEHCFGLLKQKFRQLFHMKLRSVPLIVHFIRAACVLHNIALHDNCPIIDNLNIHLDIPVIADEQMDDQDYVEPEARIVRQQVVNALEL